jgi:hypothetical protein
MAYIEIPDEILNRLSAMADSDFRTIEGQVCYLIQEGIKRLKTKKENAVRQKEFRQRRESVSTPEEE